MIVKRSGLSAWRCVVDGHLHLFFWFGLYHYTNTLKDAREGHVFPASNYNLWRFNGGIEYDDLEEEEVRRIFEMNK